MIKDKTTDKEREKLRHASVLWEALNNAGIASRSYARKWLKRQEDQGNIVYPDRENSEKRKFTQRQIDEIVDAFRPGGEHVWIWPGNKSNT